MVCAMLAAFCGTYPDEDARFMTAPTAVLPRSEVPEAHRWNRESVFASPEAWEAELKELAARIPALGAYAGTLHDTATLARFMDEIGDTLGRVGRIYVYAAMEQSMDSSDPVAGGRVRQAGALYAQFQATIAFSDPELLAIGRERVDAMLAEQPKLAILRHYIDDLFRRQQHVRSAEVEALLGAFSEVSLGVDDIYETFTNAELPFQPAQGSDGTAHELTQGTIDALLSHADREVRRTAWTHYADGYLAYRHTLASSYVTAIKRDVFLARARNFENSLEASLFQNNIPSAVFHNLIETYRKHIPAWHRYWAVRRKALGVETLHPYDIWAPIATSEPHVPFEAAVEMIAEGMAPLGSEYVETVRRGCLEQRWVDRYPNKGKRQGAFSSGWQGTYPFIMTNYSDNLKSMSTLAHELGHSLHSYHTWQNQPFLYANYALFVAEVASNFNQAMVRAHLMRTNSDPQFQIALIEEAMNNFHRYFFIMPILASFELEMHQRAEAGETLNAEIMNARLLERYQEGYGGELDPLGERTGITWAQFPHLYSAYYPFNYATGISAAHALAARVGSGDAEAARRYIEFLSAGSSLYPLDALKHAGVDMTTSEAVEQTFAVLTGMIDRLEQLVG
jgi:oligoendopeptidase F